MELINMSERAPLYMGLITLSTALAAVTVFWAGLLSFGLSALVMESIARLIR